MLYSVAVWISLSDSSVGSAYLFLHYTRSGTTTTSGPLDLATTYDYLSVLHKAKSHKGIAK